MVTCLGVIGAELPRCLNLRGAHMRGMSHAHPKIKSKSQRAAVQWCMADDGPWRKFAGHLQGGYKRLSFSFQQEWGLLWLRRLWTVHINIYLIEAQHFIPNCRMYSIDYTKHF